MMLENHLRQRQGQAPLIIKQRAPSAIQWKASRNKQTKNEFEIFTRLTQWVSVNHSFKDNRGVLGVRLVSVGLPFVPSSPWTRTPPLGPVLETAQRAVSERSLVHTFVKRFICDLAPTAVPEVPAYTVAQQLHTDIRFVTTGKHKYEPC